MQADTLTEWDAALQALHVAEARFAEESRPEYVEPLALELTAAERRLNALIAERRMSGV